MHVRLSCMHALYIECFNTRIDMVHVTYHHYYYKNVNWYTMYADVLILVETKQIDLLIITIHYYY